MSLRTITLTLGNIMKLIDISTRMITTAFILFTLYRFSDFNSVSSFAEAFENINSHLMNLGTSKSVVPIQNEVVLSSGSITSLEDKHDQLVLDEGDKLTSSEEKKGKGRFYKVMLVTGVVLFVGICLIGGGYYLFKTGGDVDVVEATRSLGGSAEDVAEATTSLAGLAEDLGRSVEDLDVVKTSLTGLAEEIVESTTSFGDSTENAALSLGESSGDIVEVTKALKDIVEVHTRIRAEL
uniref:Uncharacterized protein n=1 Tax=Pylaiella littoralis TaxID=2885 RepID=Q94Z15_PYLLI|nr:hypothetical protein PylioMp15 [Pylaiella littoralis]CAC50829.1 hypothetical protein [Pylaiella littoralis]